MQETHSAISVSYAFDVVANVYLLILRVSAIVSGTNWQQEDVLAGDLLQCERDRNGSTFARHIWINFVHMFGSPFGCLVVRMVWILCPRHTAMRQVAFHRIR